MSWGIRPVSFLRDIRPILDRHCLRCHSGITPPKNLDFTIINRRGHPLQPYFNGSGRTANAAITRLYQFGSTRARLFAILADKTHAEAMRLGEQDLIDLRAWCDLGGVLHDRCTPPYRYTPEGDVVPPVVRPWKPTPRLPRTPGGSGARPKRGEKEWRPRADFPGDVFARRCAGCHAKPETVIRPHWLDTRAPERSLILQAPLAAGAGGSGRCREPVFANTADLDYQLALASLRASALQAWRQPDRGHMALIEAGRQPDWATQALAASAAAQPDPATPAAPTPDGPRQPITATTQGLDTTRDLLAGATASASSIWDQGFAAGLARDGKGETRWNSQQGQMADEWLAFALPEPRRIAALAIDQETRWTRIAAFRIEVGDGDAWRTVFRDGTMPDTAICRFAPVTTDRIRLWIEGTTGNTPTIREVRAHDLLEKK